MQSKFYFFLRFSHPLVVLTHPVVDARGGVVHLALAVMSIAYAFAFHARVHVKISAIARNIKKAFWNAMQQEATKCALQRR